MRLYWRKDQPLTKIRGYPDAEYVTQGAEADIYRSGDLILKVCLLGRDPSPMMLTVTMADVQRSARMHKLASDQIPEYVPRFLSLDELQPGYMMQVMEYIPGPTMMEWLDSGRATSFSEYTLDRAYGLVDSLVEAVRALGRVGICHGDLNATNIILLDRVKIIDFGRAFPLTEEDANIDANACRILLLGLMSPLHWSTVHQDPARIVQGDPQDLGHRQKLDRLFRFAQAIELSQPALASLPW